MKKNIFHFLIIFFFALPLLATKRIPPIMELIPNDALFPTENIDCHHVLYRHKSSIVGDPLKIYDKNDTLKFINYLLSIRYDFSSLTLDREDGNIRNILKNKFSADVSGNILSQLIKRDFPSVTKAKLEAPEGKRLAKERNDANYKTWDLSIILRLAGEAEAMGIPFEREFLMKNGTLVGMKFATIYGYPVKGESIVYRTEKLGFTIEEVRKLKGLPKVSINFKKINAIVSPKMTKPLIKKLLKLLQDHNYELQKMSLLEKQDEIHDLFFREEGILTSVSKLDSGIMLEFKGWPEAKRAIGITYDGRKTHYTGRPDWTKEFYIRLLKFAYSQGYQPSYSLFRSQVTDNFEELRILILGEFGYDISGKSMYERALELFVVGGLQEACFAAEVPYSNFNDTYVSTKWNQLEPEFSETDINPILHIELLRFVHNLGFSPTKNFFEDEILFAEVSDSIFESFGFRILGPDVVKNSLRIFLSHHRALVAANITMAKPKQSETPALQSGPTQRIINEPSQQLKKIIRAILLEYPNIKSQEMKVSHSRPIGILIREKFGIEKSGYDLWLEIKHCGAFQKVLWRAKKERDWPFNGIPTKELFDEVISHIIAIGVFPSRSHFENPIIAKKVVDSLKKKYGYRISILAIKKGAKHYYKNLAKMRRAFGLGWKETPEIENSELLDALKLVTDRFSFLSVSQFRTTHSIPVGKILKQKAGLNIMGSTFCDLILDRFGSLRVAHERNNITPHWSRAFPPTREQVLDVIVFIRSIIGTDVEQKHLRVVEIFAPIAVQLKTKYRYDFIGQSIYKYSFKRFGKNGLTKVNVEAAKLELQGVRQ